MSFVIKPEIIGTFKQSEFLTPPSWAKTTMKNGGETKVWREDLEIRGLRIGENEDGNYVSFNFVIPRDVVSDNQGRVTSLYLGFPHDDTSTRYRISGQQLFEVFKAAGFEPVVDGGLDMGQIDQNALMGMRVNAQVSVGPDKNGIQRQNLNYFRPIK